MKFYIYTLGCKVNTYESNVMKDKLINNGYIEGNESDSDIYIINTCTVTNTSDNKSLKVVRRVIKNHPNSIVIVVGCMTQVNSKLLDDLNVSIILGNSGKSKIVDYIEEYKKNNKPIIKIDDIMVSDFEDMCLNNFNKTRAFVKIEDGCENYCSYCIIPFARGKVRSKKPEIVIEEVKNLIKEGHKEIVLTGIHTGHYGADLANYSFSKLLNELINIDGLERLRISSIEITELDDDFMDVLKNSKILVDHMHIPLQSGSDEILKLMNRKYDKNYFINKIERIRSIRPDISITTDIIVGFPGETEDLFNETLETVNKIRFSKIHVFPFSLRKGTKAEELPNHIDDVTKKERVKKLINISESLEKEYFNKFVGKEIEFLPEIYKEGYIIGHTGNYLLIKKKGNIVDLNILKQVTIEKVEYPYCLGK
ncbi:MAG: tRNA (N(6)-L-threonylcarbamoyladenosine(37)-C(2))-methylthiotransferase MtaB [Firmicutes bacterium]|nr:tRNA (N(6)-L-threonylcarbamoyladenosine(37)-C(2))-methylthiotransferase MtaB [Bacillota bacterium]